MVNIVGTGHAADVREGLMKSEQFMNLTVHRSDADGWQRGSWWDHSLDDRLGVSLAFAGASLLFFGAFSATVGRERERSEP